jgi:lantibiotic modifying enzyme
MQLEKKFQLWILLTVSIFGIATNAFADTGKERSQEALELAEDIGRWLANNQIHTDDGIAWPDNVLSPETVSYDLASGVAGKVVYFAALYTATGNVKYLEMAEGGADYLIGVLQEPSAFAQNPRRASLYTGISGIGVALLHVQRHGGRKRVALERRI